MSYRVVIQDESFDVEVGEDGTVTVRRGDEVWHVDVSGASDGDEIVLSCRPQASAGAATTTATRARIWGEPAADGAGARFCLDQQVVSAHVESERDRLRAHSARPPSAGEATVLRSDLPGVIRRVLLAEGTEVEAGEPILTLEAMKMENEIRADRSGRIHALLVRSGDIVEANDPLVEIRPD